MAGREHAGGHPAGRTALNPLPSGQARRALIQPRLPAPAPEEYSSVWLTELVFQLQLALDQLLGPHSGIPPESSNLPVGTMYYDANGTVKIVTSTAPPS